MDTKNYGLPQKEINNKTQNSFVDSSLFHFNSAGMANGIDTADFVKGLRMIGSIPFWHLLLFTLNITAKSKL